MQEFVKKLIERLEAEQKYQYEKAEEAEKKINLEMISISEARRKNGQCFDAAIQVIEQLAEEYNNGWIPCSKRLPEEHGKYLTTCEDIEISQIRLFDGEWNSISKVIAWREIPAPYQQK